MGWPRPRDRFTVPKMGILGNFRRSESRFKTRVVPWGSNLL